MKKSIIMPGLVAVLLLMASLTRAQKLPDVQQVSVHAPAGVNIDGDAGEWGSLQAYNNATNVFYTIANDDDKLYLVIRADDPVFIKKIIGGGINFSINPSGKKQDDNAVMITYPILDRAPYAKFTVGLNQLSASKNNTGVTDSLVTVLNNDLEKAEIKMKVSGVTTVTENTSEDLKAMVLMNNKKTLTIEIAIPLSSLKLAAGAKLMYQVALNGTAQHFAETRIDDGVVQSVTSVPRSMATNYSDYQLLSAPTDFWGEYNLAKK